MSAMHGRAMGNAKAKNPKATFSRLFKSLFKGNGFGLIVVGICIIIVALCSTFVATVMQTLIDDYITPLIGVSNPDLNPLLLAMGKWGLILFVGVIANYLIQRIMVNIGQNYMDKTRMEVFKKLESLPLSYFDTHPHGQVMSVITNDTDAMNQMITQSLVSLLSSFFTICFVFVAMVKNSWLLTLVVLFSLVFFVLAIKGVGSKSRTNFVKQQANVAKVNSNIEEIISGVKVVKVFNHEEKAAEEFATVNEELCKTMGKANGYANMMGPMVNNMGNLQYVLLVLIGAVIAINSKAGYTIGALAAFLQLARSFSNPIGQIAQQVNSVLMALAGAERVFALLDEESEVDEGYVTLVNAMRDGDKLVECKEKTNIWAWKHTHHDGTTTYVPVQGDIVFEHVDFGYVPDKIVLHDISLYAHPSQKLAFVGATGAGKTTITNLLNRFYEIQQGKIRFDGINIQKIKKADLRRALGIILQDTHLFTGTIMENLRYGRMDATDEEIINAAKLAGAHSFISMMKDGYNTMVTNDGEGLSGGQRQLLAIARAAVADPPVLIMDEATSSIDTYTEEIVQRGIRHLMEGRTVFVIAHRLSTVKSCDCIMVLDHGNIIERGSHEELIAEKGTYYKLYTGAFELE